MGLSGGAYASLLAPMKPPRPMERAPAMSSARPPRTTSFVSPMEAKPAVRANGTVMPSDTPMMASEIMRGLTLKPQRFAGGCSGGASEPGGFWASRSASVLLFVDGTPARSFSASGGGAKEPERLYRWSRSTELSQLSQLTSLSLWLRFNNAGAGSDSG